MILKFVPFMPGMIYSGVIRSGATTFPTLRFRIPSVSFYLAQCAPLTSPRFPFHPKHQSFMLLQMNLPLLPLAQLESESTGSGIAGVIGVLLYLGIIVLIIAGLWKIFAKAGKPGWASIIPFYNFIVLLEIVGKPTWWIILAFVPIVNIVIVIMVYIDLAKSFGKGVGFGLGLTFLSPIFICILGFGSAQYKGPVSA